MAKTTETRSPSEKGAATTTCWASKRARERATMGLLIVGDGDEEEGGNGEGEWDGKTPEGKVERGVTSRPLIRHPQTQGL